jgi:hypothetical protein
MLETMREMTASYAPFFSVISLYLQSCNDAKKLSRKVIKKLEKFVTRRQ